MNTTINLNYIVNLIHNKQYPQALHLLQKLSRIQPKNPDVWHLKAIADQATGNTKEIEATLQKVLNIAPQHRAALSNLAIHYRKQGDIMKALTTWNRLLSLNPNDIRALYQSGLLNHQLKKYCESELLLKKALLLNPDNVNIKLALGQSYLHQEKLELAEQEFQSIIENSPTNIAALNNLGIVYKKQCVWNKAILVLEKGLSMAPNQPELLKNLASCLTLMGQSTQAQKIYEALVENQPADIDAHHWLNHILWESQSSEFLSSYKRAIKKRPTDLNLQLALARKQHQAGLVDEAEQSLLELLRHDKKHGGANIELSRLYQRQRKFDRAFKHAKLATSHTDSEIAKEELGKAYMGIEKPERALKIFNLLLQQSPYHQGWLAYKSIALRLLGDAQYDYLCDYQKFILACEINVPQGYNSIEEFNQELVTVISQYHYAKAHPLDQTLVNGSQTGEKLFDYQIPIIKQLVSSFREQISAFLANLPKDPNHPLLQRNTGAFSETDSWSVILQSSGFHKNHYHPAGWFSSAYYASVPSCVRQSESGQGHINFGQPGFELPVPLSSEKSLAPKPGLLVLFPSYFWHGTTPFESNEKRVTTPFDIIPKQAL
ncbi:tetratricopeptide repeat protein [Thalassotalea mangrovi]|uniref:Tetratricopeptide repeat protein n=1 Tax=Thalassotalea mangrovi TaxID=2572245 RepID=A0A4U1B3Z2_9GAMM|nr:tetratricopeptide repeat protein [Thalassotalea mangrovi]TKB44675.1 tetratricopeptide repeat protein [Thalassotalea mangrovi]